MTMSGFPFQELRFDKDGNLLPGLPRVETDGITDLIVIAHGWKNDRLAAISLCEGLLAGIRAAAGDELQNQGRSWGAVGVFWPALLFRPDLTVRRGTFDDLEGGSVGLYSDDLPTEELVELARSIAVDLNDEDPDAFALAAAMGAGGGGAADDFMDSFRPLLSNHPDERTASEHVELLDAAGRDLVAVERDGGMITLAEADSSENAGQTGHGAAFERFRKAAASLRSGGAAAIARLLNQGTYFEMKARAGRVGSGLAALIADQVPDRVRIHLVGHSFGARLVAAACAAAGARPTESLSLLQGAFSHNALGTGFGDDGQAVGAFRTIIDENRVSGPTLVTHTHRDTAVGIFYALASTVSGVIASSHGLERLLGGPNDPHGGIGANGARSMRDGEAVGSIAQAEGLIPDLIAGRVNNVLCDFIVSDHNDVANARVGALVWRALDGRSAS